MCLNLVSFALGLRADAVTQDNNPVLPRVLNRESSLFLPRGKTWTRCAWSCCSPCFQGSQLAGITLSLVSWKQGRGASWEHQDPVLGIADARPVSGEVHHLSII